jgi:hypothetical protein
LAALEAALRPATACVCRCQEQFEAAAGAVLAARMAGDEDLRSILAAPAPTTETVEAQVEQLGLRWLRTPRLARTPIGLFRPAGRGHPLNKGRSPCIQLAAFPDSTARFTLSGTTQGIVVERLHQLFAAGAAPAGGESGGGTSSGSGSGSGSGGGVGVAEAELRAMFAASVALDDAVFAMQRLRNAAASLHGYDSRGASAVPGQFALLCLVCGDDDLLAQLLRWLARRPARSPMLDAEVMCCTAERWECPPPPEHIRTAADAFRAAMQHELVQQARAAVQQMDADSSLTFSEKFRAAVALVRALADGLRSDSSTNAIMIGLLIAGRHVAGEGAQARFWGQGGGPVEPH